jgi:hypothetical protein
MIGALPTGSKGFDCNTTVSSYTALKFAAAGYRFAVRYVRRVDHHEFDITPKELVDLFKAGLAVMLVQHVAPPAGIRPVGSVASTARRRPRKRDARVRRSAARSGAISRKWGTAPIRAMSSPTATTGATRCGAGFDPGLYVGYRCGLSADDLYGQLKFQRYWAAYNLDKPNYPAVRGVQMRQYEAKSADHVPGVSFEFDVNLIGRDAMGGTPALMLPPLLAAA